MAERKGASYRIKSGRPVQTHAEHAQTTQATGWSKMFGGGEWSQGGRATSVSHESGTVGMKKTRPSKSEQEDY